MKSHWWLEFKSPARLVVFVVVVALAIALCRQLPPELFAYKRRAGFNPVALMFLTWLAGWFGLLFVKMEDLSMLNPFNYQAALRVLSVVLIAGSLFFAAFLVTIHLPK